MDYLYNFKLDSKTINYLQKTYIYKAQKKQGETCGNRSVASMIKQNMKEIWFHSHLS